jgi:hypothetical protein
MDKRQLRKYKRAIREAEQRVSKRIIDRMIELKAEENIRDIELGEPTNQEIQLTENVFKLLGGKRTSSAN